MSKKIFTVLLLAVFMLAQFSIASAVAVTGDASITAIPDFSVAPHVDLDWAAARHGRWHQERPCLGP
ncbi:MAG: hypothetical protein IPO36_20410 [Anaerolineales bacterium]|nr:hypothetical protein [Anaerolineales bacterium]